MDLENLNNDMIPVGTTVHINPEDIKWEVKGDLISRSALKKSIKSYADDQYTENEYLGECAIMDIIDNAPSVEYTFEEAFQKTVCEQRLYCPAKSQGEWLWLGDNPNPNHKWSCNKCGRGVKEQENFCPNCGARMVRNETNNRYS